MDWNLHRNVLPRPEVYLSWSFQFISCVPAFSHTIIVRWSGGGDRADRAEASGSGVPTFRRQPLAANGDRHGKVALSKVK